MVPLVATDPKDPLARPERREDLERKVRWVPLAETASRVLWVYLGQEVPKGPPERTVTRVKLVAQDRREAKATKEKVVLQVPVVSKA